MAKRNHSAWPPSLPAVAEVEEHDFNTVGKIGLRPDFLQPTVVVQSNSRPDSRGLTSKDSKLAGVQSNLNVHLLAGLPKVNVPQKINSSRSRTESSRTSSKDTPTGSAVSTMRGSRSKKNGCSPGDYDAASTAELLRCLQASRIQHKQVSQFLRAKANPNTYEETFGWSPIIFAASSGSTVALRLLLDADATPDNACRHGNTALHLAARGGHSQVAELLISRQSDLEARNADGWTPLTQCAMFGSDAVAFMLLRANAQASSEDYQGRTPCMWAARHGHVAVVRILVSTGLDLNVRDCEGLTVMDHAKENRALRHALKEADGRCRNPNLANSGRSISCFSFQTPANSGGVLSKAVTAPISPGSTRDTQGAPAHAGSESQGDQAPILPKLPQPTNPGDSEVRPTTAGMSAPVNAALRMNLQLLDCAKENFWQGVQECLAAGACAAAVEADTLRSSLMWAAVYASSAAVLQIAEARGDLEARDHKGNTAVHFAIISESPETLSTLYYVGADLSARLAGDTPLHLAARSNNAAIVQVLWAALPGHGEAPDARGLTPLQVAASCGAVSSLQTLLTLRASPDCIDPHTHRTVLMLAATSGHAGVVRALLEPLPPLPEVWPGEADLAVYKNLASGRQVSNMTLETLAEEEPTRSDEEAEARHMKSDGQHKKQGSKAPPNRRKVSKPPHVGHSHTGKSDAGKSDADSVGGSDADWPPSPTLSPATLSPATALSPTLGRRPDQESAAARHSPGHSRRFSRKTTSAGATPFAGGRAGVPPPVLRRSGSLLRLQTSAKLEGEDGEDQTLQSENQCAAFVPLPRVEPMSEISLLEAAATTRALSRVTPPQAPLAAYSALAAKDQDGRAVLALAIHHGHTEVAQILLRLSADPHATDNRGTTCLMLAAARGEQHLVSRLLELRARIEARDHEGQSAVDLASCAATRRLLQQQQVLNTMESSSKPRAGTHKQQGGSNNAGSNSGPSKSASLPALVPGKAASPEGTPTCRVRLENLPRRMTAEDLEELIRELLQPEEGNASWKPSHVDVAVDPITGRPRGHAYADFTSAEAAAAVVEIGDGARVMGCIVRVVKGGSLP